MDNAFTTKNPISYTIASGQTKTMKKTLEAYTLGAGARLVYRLLLLLASLQGLTMA